MTDYIKNYLEKISVGLLSIIVFLFPIQQKIIAPFIILWCFFTLIYILVDKRKFVFNKPSLLLLAFYVYLIIGLLWTNNMKAGSFDLEVKMSLAIFPFFMLFLQYNLKSLKWVIRSFYLGLFLGSFYLLYGATLKFLIYPSFTYFFYVELSKFIHPTYLSLYFVVAIGIVLADLNQSNPLFFKRKRLAILLISYFFIFTLLLLSKIGIITVLLLVLFYLFRWSIVNKKILYLSLVVILIGGVFYISYEKYSYFNQRVNEMVTGLTESNVKPNNGSTGIRLQIWKQSISIIKEKPIIGYGTGDVKDVLVKQYGLAGMDMAKEKQLNAHNQFVQTTISLGILGLILFLYFLYSSVYSGLLTNNLFIVNFVLIFCFFFFTESILETQAGTIFFGLFFSLLNQKIFEKK